jgi:shikimate dehydrogenase
MPLLGLIGYPLAHSFSPGFFREKFSTQHLYDWDYQLFPIKEITSLPALISDNPRLVAFNVTIPHKKSVLDLCDVLTEDVVKIGASNLVIIDRPESGKPVLTAYNTDHYGFSESLKAWPQESVKKALVLGSGGSSQAIQYSLGQMTIDFDVAGRNLPLNYKNINLALYELIINCTPVGMQKEGVDYASEALPLPYGQVHEGQYFYDLVYNPGNTAMMDLFARGGAKVRNGLKMLQLQAEKGWGIIQLAINNS